MVVAGDRQAWHRDPHAAMCERDASIACKGSAKIPAFHVKEP